MCMTYTEVPSAMANCQLYEVVREHSLKYSFCVFRHPRHSYNICPGVTDLHFSEAGARVKLFSQDHK